MAGNRRDFLKLAGLTAVGAAGVSSIKATDTYASEADGHAEPSTDGVRLAMVVDLRKFSKNDALIGRCVEACNRAHNVPNFENDPKNEVKWIWSDDFETAFHSPGVPLHPRGSQGQTDPAAVQPLRQPAVHPGLPHPGDLEARFGRHRHDGLAPLHRLPLLRGRLPVRVPLLQLEGPAAGH